MYRNLDEFNSAYYIAPYDRSESKYTAPATTSRTSYEYLCRLFLRLDLVDLKRRMSQKYRIPLEEDASP